MRRLLLVLAAAALMAMMLVAMAAPALARERPSGNPTFKDNPYASIGPDRIVNYKAPPAYGGDPPKSSAKGGSPGFELNKVVVLGFSDTR